MRRIGRSARRLVPVGVGLALLAQMFVFGAPAAQAQDPVPFEDAVFDGHATGTPVFARALGELGGDRLADLNVAFSGAAVDSENLSPRLQNEIDRDIHPNLPDKNSYARGSGLEARGIPAEPDDEPALVLIPGGSSDPGFAEADAPPNSTDQSGAEIDARPLAFAGLLEGEASARWSDMAQTGLPFETCVLGEDFSRGIGRAADVRVIDTDDLTVLALDDPDPTRAVTQSTSRTFLVPDPQRPGAFGVRTEVRMTFAPISLFQAGDVRTITVELLGEWVLRATTYGRDGGAEIHFGPGEVSPQTPLIRILTEDDVTDILNLEDLDPLLIPVQDILGNLDPVVEVRINEGARNVVEAADGTHASAAIDVVRITALPGTPLETEVRVGHMEVSSTVPRGGIECRIPVSKSADPQSIRIGEEPDTTTITLTVHNVFDCELQNLVLTDRIRPAEGTSPNFILSAADPTPDSPPIPTDVIREADVVWSLGTIPIGETRTVTLDLTSATEGGVIEDIAEAAADLGNCTGVDLSDVSILGLSAPVRVVVETPVTGAAARQTAGVGGALVLLATGLGLYFRRRASGI